MIPLESFNKTDLAILPTPMYKLYGISRHLGANIYIKRDDMTGVALGGNKVRKLEYLLADAVSGGYTTVITTGGAQSNHAMLTAACCLRLGLEPILILKKRGVYQCRGNQVLNKLMGVRVDFVDTDNYSDVYAYIDEVKTSLEAQGKKVYVIPVGGSVPLGSLGYVNCIQEAKKQADEVGVKFDRIVCATGSGGTHAGIAVGAQLYMPETIVTGMSVDTDPFETIVPNLMDGIAKLLQNDEIKLDAHLIHAWGEGYAIPSDDGNAAIELMAKCEGIFLDPVYTGKAFGGLIKALSNGTISKDETILFMHTGGAGGLFAFEH